MAFTVLIMGIESKMKDVRNTVAHLAAICVMLFAWQCSVAGTGGSGDYRVPEPAPELSLPDLSGAIHRLSDHRGEVLIVNFWASWCAPCIREMPALVRIEERLKESAGRVLAVNSGESTKRIQRYLKRNPTALLVLLDQKTRATAEWQVESLPTSFIVDPSGQIVMRLIGEADWDDPALLERIRGYRKKQGSSEAVRE